MTFIWFFAIGFLRKILFLFYPNENLLGFHMSIIRFCTMDGFFRILEKTLFDCRKLTLKVRFWHKIK